jgi:hypothetical protein
MDRGPKTKLPVSSDGWFGSHTIPFMLLFVRDKKHQLQYKTSCHFQFVSTVTQLKFKAQTLALLVFPTSLLELQPFDGGI